MRARLPSPRLVTTPRVFGFVAALAVGSLFVLYVRAGDHASRASWQERLATVAAERTRVIDTWMRERTMDTRVLAGSRITREAVLARPGEDASHARVASLRRHLERFCATYGYADVALLRPDGSLVASCTGRAPDPATVLWALRPAVDDVPLVQTIDLVPQGLALRFALPVVPERRPERTRGRTTGAVVLTTEPLMSMDAILLPRIGGTRTGRVVLAPTAPEPDADPAEVRAVHPVLGGTRFLVATIAAEEALGSARAAALSQGLIAVGAILLPLLLAAIGWQRERAKNLREALRQQEALLEARAYADAIVQSIDAVVWEATVGDGDGGAPTGDLDRCRFSFVSKRVESILGQPSEEWLGCANLWLDHVVRDDRTRVAAFYAAVAAGATQDGSVEFRARRADGSAVWLRDRVLAVTLDGLVCRLRGVLVDVTKRVRAEQDTAALLAVARDVGAAVDRRELLARVLRRTAEVLPCDRVITFLRDAGRDVLRVTAHHGLRPERVAAIEALEFRPGQPLGGRVLAGETIALNDVQEQPWLPAALYESFGVTALVAAPLHLRGRPAGALVAFATVPNRAPFERRQVTLLEGIARQLAVGLEVAEYHEGLAEEAVVSSALARVGRELIAVDPEPGELLEQLCALTVEVLGSDVSHTLLQQAGGETLGVVASHGSSPEERAALAAVHLPQDVVAPLFEQLTAHALVQVEPRLGSSSVAERLRAALGVETLLCLPLRRGGQPVGIHCAGYRRAGAVEARHLRIARGLAEIASTVFDRVELVAELERASRVRSDFIATMSHELRTPLHIITGYQEILLDGGAGELSAEQHDTLVRCQRNAQTLLELVNATLDLTRLDAGFDPPVHTPVDVAEIVDAAIGDLADLARKPGVALVVEHPERAPQLATDPIKLKVIVKNLIGNAIKFTDRGTVTVRTGAAEHGVAVTVSDSGIGIPENALAFIFEPFRQVDASNTRRHGGVGLGLHIVQRLADTLGGTISVESHVGRGSTFRLWLPRDAAGLKERAA